MRILLIGLWLFASNALALDAATVNKLGFGDAFADVGKLDDVLAHRHASRVSMSARPTRAGPGK